MSKRYVFARATTTVFVPQRCTVIAGQVWHAEHPAVLKHPDLFSADPPEVLPRDWEPPAPPTPPPPPEPKVEQATKAPGEKRSTRRGN